MGNIIGFSAATVTEIGEYWVSLPSLIHRHDSEVIDPGAGRFIYKSGFEAVAGQFSQEGRADRIRIAIEPIASDFWGCGLLKLNWPVSWT